MFTPGVYVIYFGDTQAKWAYFDSEALSMLGVEIQEHGKMPDVLVHHVEKKWLALIEAVTSHGPVNPKRRQEMGESHMKEHHSKIEEILAKDEIREVIVRLARGTDRRDRDLMRSCYHPDAMDDHGAFRGGGDEFADWVVETLQPMKTQHFLGQIRIEIEGNAARAESYCEAHHIFEPTAGIMLPEGLQSGTMDWIMWLRYLDRFERRAMARG